MKMKQDRKRKWIMGFRFCTMQDASIDVTSMRVENLRSSMKVERRCFERTLQGRVVSSRGPWLSLDKHSIISS
jgi:hypothetical protein